MCNERKCLLSMFLIFFAAISTTNAAFLRSYRGQSLSDYDEFGLDSPLGLLESPGYNSTRQTVIYAFGFQGKVNGESIKTVIGTFMQIGGYNVILLNWEKEANSPAGAIAYGKIVLTSVEKIGTQLGEALVQLVSAGLDINKLYLVGFSLGAHLFGFAGRLVQKHDLLIPRITGLDPAGPLYDENFSKSLTSDCAGFVDVFHTDGGILGTIKSRATVDIWFDCERRFRPGCEDDENPDLCNHNRSWLYYSESRKNTTSFVAISASNCLSWVAENGNGNGDIIYLGGNDTLSSGDFYLSANSESPYGKGPSGVRPTID